MMKNIVNICLISFIVIQMVDGDIGRQNRRVKRLGNSRNTSNKFKKGENFCILFSTLHSMSFSKCYILLFKC